MALNKQEENAFGGDRPVCEVVTLINMRTASSLSYSPELYPLILGQRSHQAPEVVPVT